ncbi:hypothetical protein D3C78_1664360 [compost metagenome]
MELLIQLAELVWFSNVLHFADDFMQRSQIAFNDIVKTEIECCALGHDSHVIDFGNICNCHNCNRGAPMHFIGYEPFSLKLSDGIPDRHTA